METQYVGKMAQEGVSNEELSLGIPQFYAGKNILITGVTGFMGKVLLEKLLRSCPEVGKIYMIIREKKGKNRYERLKEITDLPLFDLLKSKQCWSDVEKKCVALNGDISQLNIGLSEEDYQVIVDNVSIIFHVAANVRFDDPLPEAIKMNTRGTREVIELCLKMKSLKALLHVSTTYCNCNRKVVEEVVYPRQMEWRDAISTVEKLQPEILNIVSKKYIDEMPNTYTFTKSLAEDIVWEYRDKLPVIIFRPSIVISSWKDPVPGWLDNLNGPMGLLVGAGKGVIRTCMADKNVTADYMPVDVAIRGIITAVWHHSTKSYRTQDQSKQIYNCSSTSKSVTTHELMMLGLETAEEFPFSKVLWRPTAHFTTSKMYFTINALFKHLLPAIIVDTLLTIANKKPRLVRLQQRIYRTIVTLSYFTLNQWTFINNNFIDLNSYIYPADKPDFDFDISEFDVKDYFRNSSLGLREYLLHEDPSLLPEARQKAKRMYWVENILLVIFAVLLVWFLSWQPWALNTLKRLKDYIIYF